jgi:predicted negative regulator of RcsB-dependent stress response
VEQFETEDQQVEAIKKWWRENGQSIIVGIVLGLTVMIGWRWWHNQQREIADAASFEFYKLGTDLERDLDDQALQRAKQIQAEYPKSIYAVFAAMEEARLAESKEDRETARTQLQWAMDHSPLPELAAVARLRLARVWLDGGDTARAREVLGPVAAIDAFKSLYEEAMGDIYLAEGSVDEAREAYLAARREGSASSSSRERLLQMKLDDLGSGQG